MGNPRSDSGRRSDSPISISHSLSDEAGSPSIKETNSGRRSDSPNSISHAESGNPSIKETTNSGRRSDSPNSISHSESDEAGNRSIKEANSGRRSDSPNSIDERRKKKGRSMSPEYEQQVDVDVEEEEAGSSSPNSISHSELGNPSIKETNSHRRSDSPNSISQSESDEAGSSSPVLMQEEAFEILEINNVDSQGNKYRPRKPEYIHRINTGDEDHEYPPPNTTTVFGYKFYIFYPDLVDYTKPPTYVLDKDGDNLGTCILRFCAGPPYQDLAFRIVNREWDYSYKRGFKYIYDEGILRLHFNFKYPRCRR